MKEQAEGGGRIPTHMDEVEKQWPPREEGELTADGARDEESIYKYLRIEYW